MKLSKILSLLIGLVLMGCGSSKKVTTTKKSPTKIIVTQPVETTKKVNVPVLKPQENKSIKTTYNTVEQYIKNFAPIAIEEMKKYKIPASIKLAQGILESNSGRSLLAVRSNNHFGIKCHKGWEGKSITHDDDYIGECFRKYKHPAKSYEDHSKFLTSRKRYAKLFKLSVTDYKSWAYGLKRAGYATDSRYPQKLISIINKYALYKYDLATSNTTYTTTTTFYTVQKGDTLYSIAKRYNISVQKLKQNNSLTNNAISVGQKLFIN